MVERYHEDYTIGWICALPVEMAAAIAMLDEEHPTLPSDRSDSNTYVLGRIGLHNIVIACLPYGIYGTVSAASVGLMVGLGGGVPNMQFDIRLGDVIVGAPTRDSGGVIQYDYGKTVAGGQFEHTGSLNKPPYMALTAISRLQAQHRLYGAKISAINSEASSKLQLESNDFTYPGEDQDQVFDSSYDHPDSEATCSSCDRTKLVTRPPRTSTVPHIHYGLIASGNQVMKHGATRDRLARQYGFLCFEMEAAGLVDHFPCVVIRGICDYADSHKSKQWQAYAAMVAAAYTKELLIVMPSTSISIIERDEDVATKKLCAYDHERAHRRISHKRITNTTQWFTRHPQFIEWYGAGEHPIPSAFFYCEPDRREILEASYIVTSFINQLYPLLKSDAVAHSDALRLIRASFGADSARPEFDELASILLSVDSSMPGSIYMLDGLDLLSEKDIRALLKMFHTLLNVRQSSSRVLLFSRRYLPGNLQIPGAIPGVRHISTDLNVLGDIEEYIRESIREKTMYKKITDNAKLLADMKKRLLQKSSGMFLWVYLQLEIIWDTCITDAEIRQKLDDLPKDLEETYNHCLRRIDPSDSRIVNVLKWVSFASRPLLLGELSEATVLRVEDHKWDPGRIPNSNFVVSCCANLVVEDPVDTSVRFAHPSVRDHLLRNWNTFDSWPITAQQGELDCGEICISYLSFSDFCLQLEGQRGLATAKLPDPKLLAREATMTSAIGKLLSWRVGHKQLDPINIPSTIRANYAIENWAAQMKQINPTSPVWEKFCRLALTCNETWNFHPWMSGGRSLGSQIHALFGWAVKQGHIPLLKIAMEAGPEILQICNMPLIGEGLPALHVAAKLEDTPTLSLLLTICAVNNRDKDGRTALHHAANVEWNIRSDDHLTPIYIAARGDYLDIVSCLLDKGASAVADPSPLVWSKSSSNGGRLSVVTVTVKPYWR
ncbi:hypothetical protein BJY04DRAFT_211775 [Aspergillus karnatakaensis]|uniref:uncharacterized protein n=1 Tax=Aspergillus karnatakaensis TaxID=1810916 RepID=UPI003CCD2BF5